MFQIEQQELRINHWESKSDNNIPGEKKNRKWNLRGKLELYKPPAPYTYNITIYSVIIIERRRFVLIGYFRSFILKPGAIFNFKICGKRFNFRCCVRQKHKDEERFSGSFAVVISHRFILSASSVEKRENGRRL